MLENLQNLGVLKKKGYRLLKKNIDEEDLNLIKKNLTLEPKVHKDFVKNVVKYECYLEDKKHIYLPKHWGIQNLGNPKKNLLKRGEYLTKKLETIYPPRPFQVEIIEKTYKQLKEIGGGIITIGCGLGKTFCGINISTLINQKTLILVHTSVLLDQWIDRIKHFIPNAKIGIIRGKKFDIENKDYVVGMLQTIIRSEVFTPEDFKSFGLTVYDECFPFSQYVLTETGPIKIGTLYEKWKNKRILPKVKSYNEKTKKYEYKKITYAFRKENPKLLKISIGKKKIKCTENHKFLTSNGYKKANNLTIDDLLISNYDGYGKISKIENIIHTGYGRCTKPYVYDIEVEDNHNFIVCGKLSEMGVVVHNCHHMAAPSFSKAFPLISSKYNLGLSATPKRNDNLQNIFYWNIGPTSFESFTNDKFAIVKNINFTDDNYVEKYNWQGSIDLHKLHLQIIKNKFRNEMIIKQLINLSKKGRQILVLSKMIDHLKELRRIFCKKNHYKNYPRETIFNICKERELNKKTFSLICSFIKEPVTSGFYIGGMKQTVDQSAHSKTHTELDELIFNNLDKIKIEYLKYIYDKKNKKRKKINLKREDKIDIILECEIEVEVDETLESLEKSSKCDILFASYQLVSEGTDIPTLNTLIMTTPKKQIEQVVGRILRAKTKFTPLILDIVDSSFSVYQNQSHFRNRYYKKCNYSIDNVCIDAKDEKVPIIDENVTNIVKKKVMEKVNYFEKCII